MNKKKVNKQKGNVDDVDEVTPPMKGGKTYHSSTEKGHPSSDEKFNRTGSAD